MKRKLYTLNYLSGDNLKEYSIFEDANLALKEYKTSILEIQKKKCSKKMIILRTSVLDDAGGYHSNNFTAIYNRQFDKIMVDDTSWNQFIIACGKEAQVSGNFFNGNVNAKTES